MKSLLIGTLWVLATATSCVALLGVSTLMPTGRIACPRHHCTGRLGRGYADHRDSVILFMGKGDGKKRKKKKAATTSGSTSPPSVDSNNNTPQPLRVSTDINIPVKHQIRMAQINKQYAKQRANPSFRKKKVVRTSYRRTWDEEEIEQKKEERKKRGQDINWDVVLNQTKAAPLVIVDGYNIIYKWPRLKKHMTKGDPQRARELLVDDLENLSSIKGWRIEVVFDGTRKSNIGPLGHGATGSKTKVTQMDLATNKEVSKHGVRVVFTGRGIEADSYIESRCAKAKEVTDGHISGSFIVATDDAMIRLAGQNAGAMCMGAGRFVDELKALRKAINYRVEAAVAKVNGQTMRPESLQGTYFHNFGRGSVLVEDKRQQKLERKLRKQQEQQQQQEEVDTVETEVELDENGIERKFQTNFAQVPNQTKTWT
ncbi:RNA-binding protein containing a PIN domain [Seminavis robusta]|uniref:RNA-binding protein containing a PIN domain n=1 Tax=Seminavis robusta TaxID=568900 RepID=A0A9N8HQ63_9STRA|nr:RNA-binding protein containing a PIN domain [Seminavis robusta]|eukprot:Sro1406_g269900.1 RNA-binding protein containing a PIN domain (427) ;mRNA; r:13612-15107